MQILKRETNILGIMDVINANKAKVEQWLMKYPYQLMLSLTGLLLEWAS